MKRCAIVFASILFCVSLVSGQPAKSRIRGTSLGDWMQSYWAWALGGEQERSRKRIVFLPIPQGEPSEQDPSLSIGEQDVTLRPGEGFALPVFVYIGETYLEPQVPDDDPLFPPADVFTNARVEVVLDGKTIIDADNLEDFYFDAQFFDDPIPYDEPTEYAPDVHAIGALWVKGIGFVHGPLSKGEHTLELFVYSDAFGFGFQNTWHITVAK